jgi:hypothetical protein
MTEQLNWHAPEMDELSPKESVEMNARDHFALRLKWAEAVSEVLRIPLSETLYEYTDLALRMGFSNLENPGEQWSSFLDALENTGDDRQVQLSVLVDFYRQDQESRLVPRHSDFDELERLRWSV